jgi:hypothetical protein
MDESGRTILSKIKYIEELLTKVENHETQSILTIIRNELDELKKISIEHKKQSDDKKVVGREDKGGKTRYFLKDGSVYVIKGRSYRYLYDSKTNVVTYEFENGQIERTFENGIKEIRQKDGSIVVKTGLKDYDYL